MRIPRIFQDTGLEPEQVLTLDGQAGQHLTKVLRLKPGNRLILFNGDGNDYPAAIESIAKRDVLIRVLEKEPQDRESPLKTFLIQGVSRGDRMDFTIQKAVELGVHTIYPVLTERAGLKLKAERLERRQMHWQAVVHSACEQCGRNRIPVVAPVQDLAACLGANTSPWYQTSLKLVLHQNADTSLGSLNQFEPQAISLLAGPEGGLTENDLGLSKEAGFQALRLGPRVMRTETAALAALAVLQAQWGDF